jgi:radical SAM superfamily enzyme YgiQ (UPF0313 family)
MYISSLACPYNCAYCTNAGVYGRKWNALPPEQFVAETVDLTRRYNLEMLWVVDDNFLVDLNRARAIAAGLVEAGANFEWSIQATTNLVARLSLEDLKLLRRSGLRQVCQGAESGSPKILAAMNKDFQDFDSIYESAARCVAAGIRPSFNIIFAFPGEGPAERKQTVHFIMDMCRRFPGAEFWTNIFTPYPGAPVMQRAEEIGIQVPTSFEGWASMAANIAACRSCGTISASPLTECPSLPIVAAVSRVWPSAAFRCPRAGAWNGTFTQRQWNCGSTTN